MQSPIQSRPIDSSTDHKAMPLALKNHGAVERILNGLLQKASSEELHTLSSILHSNNLTDEPSLLSRILSEEINKHT